MQILGRVKMAERAKRSKTGIFRRLWYNRETLILYLAVHPWNMSCFYSLYAFYIAKYLYFMENKVSYANISAGQDGRAIEKVKNEYFSSTLR